MPNTFAIASNSPDSDTLGGRISRAREGLGLSTAQLARRLGVKTNTVQAWETDRSEPRANRIIMLAGMIGVSPAWLLTGIGDAPETTDMHLDLRVALSQLARLREAHEEMGRMIDTLAEGLQQASSVIDRS